MAASSTSADVLAKRGKDEVGYQYVPKAGRTESLCLFTYAVSLNLISCTSLNNFHCFLSHYQSFKNKCNLNNSESLLPIYVTSLQRYLYETLLRMFVWEGLWEEVSTHACYKPTPPEVVPGY